MKSNLTPLIDVVFLLIIFFLVSSHLARQETQLGIELPQATSVSLVEETPGSRVAINVLPDGKLILGSQQVPIDEVRRRLEIERQETSNDLEVRIRTDRQLAYRHIEPLLLACARAKIWNVSFAVVKKADDKQSSITR